jgi:hypothetical protein
MLVRSLSSIVRSSPVSVLASSRLSVGMVVARPLTQAAVEAAHPPPQQKAAAVKKVKNFRIYRLVSFSYLYTTLTDSTSFVAIVC